MDEILSQLGQLALAAVPTMILFVLLWKAYDYLVHRPMMRVLAERHARTAGAVEKARADVAAADAKTADYEQRIRDAKLALYKYQEGRRQKALEARAAALAEARKASEQRIQAARVAIEKESQEARLSLQAQADALATQVVRTILRPVEMAQSPAAGGQS